MIPIGSLITLDLATRCGYAAGIIGTRPVFGSKHFGAETGEVLSQFEAWLVQMVTEWKPLLIAIESPYVPVPKMRFVEAGTEPVGKGPPPMNPKVLRRLMSMAGISEAVAWRWGIEFHEMTTGSISKFFVGAGRQPGGRTAKKEATIRMCKMYGWDVGTDDNAADALALWAFEEHRIAPHLAMNRTLMTPAGVR